MIPIPRPDGAFRRHGAKQVVPNTAWTLTVSDGLI